MRLVYNLIWETDQPASHDICPWELSEVCQWPSDVVNRNKQTNKQPSAVTPCCKPHPHGWVDQMTWDILTKGTKIMMT